MTMSPSAARQFIFGRAAVSIVRVAYSLEETAEAWGIEPGRVSSAIHRRCVPARHNNRRYLIAGGTVLDYAIAAPRTEIHDHRLIIQPDVSYTYANLATMFGWDVQAIRRLNYSGRLIPDVLNAPRPLISGAAVLAYLNGTDEPITYHASA